MGFSMSKIHGFSGYEVRTLGHAYLVDAFRGTLFQRRNIVLRTVRERLVLKPESGKAMPLYQHYQRIQPYLLKAGREQQRKIETGAVLFGKYRIRKPHPLSRFFKACRRNDIGDVLLLQRGIDRGSLLFYDVRVFRLIAGE